MRKITLGDCIIDCASGPFGSNLKVECFVEDGFPIIDGANLKGVRVTDNITKFVTEEKARSLSRSIAKRRDVIVTISGTLGQISFIPNDSKYNEYLCSQRQFRVTFDESKIDVEYLVNYLHTDFGQKKILSFANYVGVPALAQPLPNFKKIELLIPSIQNQKKVVQVLSALDDKIALNKKMNQKLETMAKRLYDYWFVQYDFPDKNGHPYKTTGGSMTYNETLKREIPVGWEVKTLADLAEYVKTTTKFDKAFNYVSTDNMLPQKQGLSGENLKPASGNVLCYEKDDILISNIRPYFKKIWYADQSGTCSTDVLCIRSLNSDNSCFVYKTLWQDDFFDYVMQGAKGSKMPRGDKTRIMNYPICIAKENFDELIKKFSALTIPMQAIIQKNTKEISRLTKLRDKLLPLLMNGQVVVG